MIGHEMANMYPMMSKEDLNMLAKDIADNGQRELVYTYEGKILDGRNRYAASLLAGVVPKTTTYKGTDPLAFVVSVNSRRRHMTASQAAASAALAKMGLLKSISPAELAKKFGANYPYVLDAIKLIEIHGRRDLVERMHKGTLDLCDATRTVDPNWHALLDSESNEWYTPRKEMKLVRAALGGIIDLDPASCPIANKVVKAKRFFTKSDNGLSRDWSGKVYLAPPYGKDKDFGWKNWTNKLVREVNAGKVSEAVVLVRPNVLGTRGGQPLFEGDRTCFYSGRIAFYTEVSEVGRKESTIESIFVYFGPNVKRFEDIFSEVGSIVRTTRRMK